MDPILFWNEVVNEADRKTHTTGAPSEVRSQGPCGSSRAYSIVHLAMHDAYFGINPGKYDTYLEGMRGSRTPTSTRRSRLPRMPP